ncbi:MAG: SRPBCC domain-containing protein [Ferruginibacter sp.]
MKTSTITIEILAPIQAVWKALSTTEGMKAWLDWLKVETDWQQNSPVVFTCFDKKGEILEYKGEKMIFKGIIESKMENKEITFDYPEQLAGIIKERYTLNEINASATSVSFTQTCTDEKAQSQEEDQKQLMEMLKTKLEEK